MMDLTVKGMLGGGGSGGKMFTEEKPLTNGNGRPAKGLFSIRDLVSCDEPKGTYRISEFFSDKNWWQKIRVKR